MYADVKIGEKVVPMVGNAATKIYYKQLFSKDLITIMNKARTTDESGMNENAMDLITELAYVMKVQAEKSGFSDKNFESYVAWLEEFEPFEIETAASQIMAIYTAQQVGTSTPKNA